MWCPNQECPDALESGSPAEFVDGMISRPFCGVLPCILTDERG